MPKISDNPEVFGEDYFIRGKLLGISNYENYRWLPEPTTECCRRISKYLHMQRGDTLLDFGSGPGHYTRAFRELGYEAFGYDISVWAVKNCNKAVDGLITGDLSKALEMSYDWVLAKDVFEHIPRSQLNTAAKQIMEVTRNAALLIVPLARDGSNEYVREEDNSDATHEICWSLEHWLSYLQSQIGKHSMPFTVCGGYQIPGVKPAADAFPKSTGFITLRRYI